MLEWIAMIIALSLPYDGPLAERQMPMPGMKYVGVICPIDPEGPDAQRVRRLSARLEKQPLAVRAPETPELGYGLMGYEGQIFVVGFNLMLIDAAQQLQSSGRYPPGESEGTVLAAARILQGGLPNSGENLEWALGALASLGLPNPPWPFDDIPDAPPDFPALVVDWKTRVEPYDRAMVHDLLRRWGLDPAEVRARALGAAADAPPGD